jgi:hypothetical protein
VDVIDQPLALLRQLAMLLGPCQLPDLGQGIADQLRGRLRLVGRHGGGGS